MPIFPAKRESFFPPDSVEAVVPVMAKRRRLCRADMVPVDAWRVYLALKSGLLAESTWAIDVLNVLLYDDSSVHYFSLAYMPGLTEVLLEHFRRCLSQIFTILEDMEIGFDRIEEFKSKLKQRSIKPADSCQSVGETATEEDEDAWWNWPKRKAEPDGLDVADLGAVKSCDLAGERVRYLDGPDWSMNTRRGEKVGVVSRDKELFVVDVKKEWDVHDGLESGMDQWQIGGGDTTQHIVSHFTAELGIVPFVRVLKKVDKKAAEQAAKEAETNEMDCQVELTGEKEAPAQEPSNATPNVSSAPTKNCLMSKPSRSLADVLKRIKKEDVAVDQEMIAEPPQPEVTNEAVKLVGPSESRLDETEIKKESTTEPIAERPVVKLPARQPESSSTVMVLPSGNRLVIRDPHGTLKRRKMDEYEDECYTRDESSLYLVDDSQDALARRALALSNIFRSLSFVPSNETELAKNSTLLVIVGKILLLHHDHPLRSSHQKNYDREEDVDFASVDSLGASGSASSKCETDWWWDTLLALRENVLVLMSNIAGQLDLSIYSEEIVRPVIDGLLHWAICPSAQSQDPFSSFGPHSTSLLSPQRLSLETLSKLMVMDCNMDLILATPPFLRLEKLVHFLTRSLCRTEDQVLREFAVNLLYYLSAADSGMARLIALHNNSLALLVSFVEQAEANALAVASQHGIQALRENPESMGTSLDMLRRAASTVFHISRHPESRPLLAKLEQRLLALVMSQIMDQSVAALLSKSLYLCNSDDE
jgi:AT-rich interactive domain-containing protein 1